MKFYPVLYAGLIALGSFSIAAPSQARPENFHISGDYVNESDALNFRPRHSQHDYYHGDYNDGQRYIDQRRRRYYQEQHYYAPPIVVAPRYGYDRGYNYDYYRPGAQRRGFEDNQAGQR